MPRLCRTVHATRPVPSIHKFAKLPQRRKNVRSSSALRAEGKHPARLLRTAHNQAAATPRSVKRTSYARKFRVKSCARAIKLARITADTCMTASAVVRKPNAWPIARAQPYANRPLLGRNTQIPLFRSSLNDGHLIAKKIGGFL